MQDHLPHFIVSSFSFDTRNTNIGYEIQKGLLSGIIA